MRRSTLTGGMAMVWRLSTRRAGRRTLATLGGLAVFWVVTVMVLPTILPPSMHTSSQALPPAAHRRIHQQQTDADYTGFKQGGLLVKEHSSPQLKKGDTGVDVELKKGVAGPKNDTPQIENEFPMQERGLHNSQDTINGIGGELNHNYLQKLIHQPHEPEQSILHKKGNKPLKSVVFAPINPNIELNLNDFHNEDQDAGAPVNKSKRPSNSHQNPLNPLKDATHDELSDPNTTKNEIPSNIIADDNSNTAGEVDRVDVLSNAAEETDAPKQSSGDGLLKDEGPYTLPILKAPKDGAALPKRGGYLSHLPGGHHPLPVEDGDDVGEGSVQPVVPFRVAKGAFRGVGGVFPIHPVEFQHAGGMMGDVYKKGANVQDAQEQAQIMAMAALQHGHRITQKQRDLVDKLSPDRKKRLELRAKEMRIKQEQAYLIQLRDRKQIVPAKGGGEKVLSHSRVTVRFPTSLKQLQPEAWPPAYRVYLNITHSPWQSNPGCASLLTTFARPHSLLLRAIASFPSSGNTWIR